MKITHPLLLLAAFAPVAVFQSGCSKSADSSSSTAMASSASVSDTASETWNAIKDYTFEKRDQFVAGFDRMIVKMDDDRQAAAANAADHSAASVQERDAATKAYDSARADLKANLAALSNATSDTWASAKDKVAQSWQAVKDAYARMKTSVTS